MSDVDRACPHCQATREPDSAGGSSAGPCPACGRSPDEAVAVTEDAGPRPVASGPRGRSRKAVVLAVTLVVLVGAGGSIAWSLSQADWFRPRDWIREAATHKPAPARSGGAAVADAGSQGVPRPEDPSERCELRIFRGESGSDPVVVLTGPGKMTEFRPGYFGGHSRLAREVVRQAVLMAVRDGLNLPVRDAVVGDPPPAGAPSEVLEVDALCRNGRTAIAICREAAGDRKVLLEATLRTGPGAQADYRGLVEAGEAMVRDSLPRVLTEAGLAGRPAPKGTADDRLPDAVEVRLGKMAFVEAFAALRALHAAIRSDGPSPRRIQALARAYANLGVLTEYQWDASSRAYKARALLYAQTLVAADPKSPEARWHRAYAASMAGLYGWALDDLNEARKLVEAMPAADRPKPPGWVPLLEALGRYDHRKLDEVRMAGGPDYELAALLYLLSVEQPSRAGIALRAARGTLAASPECFRAYAVQCEGGGIAALHLATTAAPEALSRRVPRRIATLPGLPEPVRQAALRADEVAMTKALEDATADGADPVEPSWAALARIVRETRFVFTFRRIYFMAVQWSVPTGDYWEEVRPMVAGHRFRPLIEAYAGSDEGPDLQAFAADLDTTDFDMNSDPLVKLVADVDGPGSRNGLYGIKMLLSDRTARDLGLAVEGYTTPPQSVDLAHKLLAASPNSPFAMARLIEDAWDQAQAKLDQWRKLEGEHPTFLAGMARHLVKSGPPEEAERTLERYIKLSADKWAYEALADLYRRRGDGARWKSTLDEFLAEGEDYGLDHARIRVDIAEELMRVGRYDEARPYADAAARTWAGWAMSCAQKCAEAQKDWEAAEAYARASSQRYPGSMWTIWFLFCERNGQGDVASARAWTSAVSAGFLQSPGLSADTLLLITYVQLLCGHKDKAGEAIRRIPADLDNPVYVASLAATADLAGLPEVRDAALGRFCKEFGAKAPKSARVLQTIRDAIAAKTPGKLDLPAIDEILDSIPKARKGNTAFSVAAHLTAAGRLDEARRYWAMVADGKQSNYWWQSFAMATLHDRYPKDAGGRSAGEK